MEEKLSWWKAYGGSFAFHGVILVALVLCLHMVTVENAQETYEVDLETSVLSPESSSTGGGGAKAVEKLFPEPLKASDMAERVKQVEAAESRIQSATPVVTNAPAVAANTPAPAAITPSDAGDGAAVQAGGTAGSASGGAEAAGSGGGVSGAGSTGNAGTGSGAEAGGGSGAGSGPGEGNGSGPFDRDGFWAAVNANKEYPYMAIQRNIEGVVTVQCTLTASGSIQDVSVASSSGYSVLDKAAVAAVRSVGHYPNATNQTITVTTNVHFTLS